MRLLKYVVFSCKSIFYLVFIWSSQKKVLPLPPNLRWKGSVSLLKGGFRHVDSVY